MNKQVYSYEQEITQISTYEKFGKIILSLSKYNDCLFVVVNQTGTVGSIVNFTLNLSFKELPSTLLPI